MRGRGNDVALAGPLALLLALGGLLAATAGPDVAAASPQDVAPAPLDPADLDPDCKPCDNFFQYANGGWLARHPIPAAHPSWGRFSALRDRNQVLLRQILEGAARSPSPAGSLEQKIGDFYAACMDTRRIESDGIRPIEPVLRRIANLSDPTDLPVEVARLHAEGVGVLFRFGSGQDDRDSTRVIGIASQGGLGLPDRDYYTRDDEKSRQLREQYEQHVTRMFRLAGDSAANARAAARTVLDVETRLARASKTRVERRDPEANYHKMGREQLQALTPAFSWDGYFRQLGFPEIAAVNVGQPEFFQALDRLLTEIPLTEWKSYLRWHLLRESAPALSSRFVNENFSFYGRALTGTREILPRWRRCVTATDRYLGEALGQKYVQAAFPPQARERAQEMVQRLVAALREDIESLPWMGEETRRQALAKLAAMSLKIGYPDRWRDYSSYEVARGPYIENLWRGERFEFRRRLAKIGRPVDRGEWSMTPPTVNAYYDPNLNEIVFPAGILQAPFFDAAADDALNYGGIGAVIGHEMTHGFDDQGSRYDAEGNLRNWWTAEDLERFRERATCIEKQFDAYVVADGLHLNGKLVVGESIADLGGLTLAHMAFVRTPEGKSDERIGGYTPEQRFFLAWARVWGAHARPEYERMMTAVDPHPLPRFRANGPLSNLPAFQRAFSCRPGDAMVRPEDARCKIW